MDKKAEKPKMLLVDDEEDFLLASSQALRRRGFEVDVAPNGVTALEKIEETDYHIVVLDVKMPDIDGIDVFRQIKKKTPGVPVILLTGHSSISDAFQTSKEGIADYLSKPIDMDELARRIHQAIKEARKKLSAADSESILLDINGAIRVMLVDDEEELLDSLKKVLERRKLEIITAKNGPEALDLLKKSLVDIMVLDVKMPVMDGLEVLRQVKKDFPSVEVILLSGHPSVEAAMEGVRLGAGEYLKKPPDIDALVATIKNLYISRKKAHLENQKKLIEEIKRRYPE